MNIVAYDAENGMVNIAAQLMVPVPVYNYAKYIKKVCQFGDLTFKAHLSSLYHRTLLASAQMA